MQTKKTKICIRLPKCANSRHFAEVAVQATCDLGPILQNKLTWKKLIEKDCREWKLTTVGPHERSHWRSGERSAMCEASQLPGRGPTDVEDVPIPAG